MKASELIKQGKKTLVASRENLSWKTDEKLQVAELLADILDVDEIDESADVSRADARKFEKAIARRAKGEPIPYITGWTEFRGLRMTVKPGAFVPRHSSEELAAHAIKRLTRRQKPIHLDLATGIGPVALAVANEVKRARVFGADLNARAIAQARANARALKIRNVTFVTGDLFAPLPESIMGKIDVITIHPPYIPKGEVRTLPAELKEFEPFESLTDQSSNGLGLFGRVAREAPDWLSPRGWLLVECDTQAAKLFRAILSKSGFRDVASHVGRFSYSRIVAARS